MPFLPLPPRTVGAWGRKRFVGEIHTRGGHTALCCCLISSFYIKPQRLVYFQIPYGIVLYRLSTSNHNSILGGVSSANIVLYRLSTSNHNHIWLLRWPVQIVLYRLSTSNHNYVNSIVSIPEIVLYRLSTSNHNNRLSSYFRKPLSYIVFLHQTTTFESNTLTATNCLISSFYIKPQPHC